MSAARQKGTAWETAVVNYLRGRGWPNAERRAMGGAQDRGDIAGVPLVVIEAKNAARITLAEWLDEAFTEATRDHADMGVVWIKRRSFTSPGAGYVLMDGHTFTDLLHKAGY